MPTKLEQAEVNISSIKSLLSEAICTEFGSVAEFSRSKEVTKLGIDSNTLSNYLSPSGSVSISVLNKLMKRFGIKGKLTSKVVVNRQTLYFIRK